jgi:hypothetical protein
MPSPPTTSSLADPSSLAAHGAPAPLLILPRALCHLADEHLRAPPLGLVSGEAPVTNKWWLRHFLAPLHALVRTRPSSQALALSIARSELNLGGAAMADVSSPFSIFFIFYLI